MFRVGCFWIASGLMAAGLYFEDNSRLYAQEGPPKGSSAIELARASFKKAEGLHGYSAVFTKRERHGKKLLTQRMKVKIRHQPYSVYMFFERPHQGREVIFVTGRDQNQLLVHESGLLKLVGTLQLDPHGDDAMDENLYPITKLGIANMASIVADQWESELRDKNVTFRQSTELLEGNVKCQLIESNVAPPATYHRTRLWINEATGLPVKVQRAGFPTVTGDEPPVVEEYTYSELDVATKLTDLDFDTSNPAYHY